MNTRKAPGPMAVVGLVAWTVTGVATYSLIAPHHDSALEPRTITGTVVQQKVSDPSTGRTLTMVAGQTYDTHRSYFPIKESNGKQITCLLPNDSVKVAVERVSTLHCQDTTSIQISFDAKSTP